MNDRPGMQAMTKRVLALGLDPACVDLEGMPQLTPEMIRAYIEAQLERVRQLGYAVESCLVDRSPAAESTVARRLQSHRFDGVVIGAGLRAPAELLLFERLLNLVHAHAPAARLCFNSSPADTAEAVQRWL